MKKLLIAIICCTFLAFGTSTHAKNLQAYLSYTIFMSPVDGPYLDTYLAIIGNSVNYIKNDNDKYQATIAITIIFRQGDEIVDFAKYELRSPEVIDTNLIDFNIIDQQRYVLANGNYDMEIIISDPNSGKEPYITTEPVEINYPKEKICISGIELIELFRKTQNISVISKGGYDLLPYVINYYPQSVHKLSFYNEIYNTDKEFELDGMFLISYYIESFETGKKLNDYQRNKRETIKPVVALIGEFDITYLPSGNYNLIIEARDKNNNMIANNKLFFQRSNPNVKFDLKDLGALDIANTFAGQIKDVDTLRQYILCLGPICTEMERVFTRKHMPDADLLTMQRFFLNFWQTRDNVNPGHAWEYYLGQVNKVNVLFKTPYLPGYDTDRGRVFLKYGPPNIIAERHNEPAAYPYEIWQYYILGEHQRNKKFVFYTFDIVTNDFQLVHSDAIGEISNYRWQIFIYNRTYDPVDIDADRYPDTWGSKVNDYWDNPY